jgi:SulP family sulfate permease
VTAALGFGSVAVIMFWPKRLARLVPGSMVVLVGGTLAVSLGGLGVETIGTRFGAGAFPRGLPAPAGLVLDWDHVIALLTPALAITLMGAIESLLSAVVSDGMIDDRHDSNQELMGQGVANMVVPFFGGIPVTGVIARTATNVRNGAVSPVAGMVHAFTLLAVVLVAAPLAQDVPLAVLGAVLLVVAFRMGEWDEFLVLRRQARSDAAVFLLTFVLTVVFDLTVAVKAGLILAAFLFIKRVADTTQVFAHDEAAGLGHEPLPDLPRGVMVYRVFGALLFGAADKLDSVMRRANSDTRVIILHLGAVTALDGTALRALETLHEKLRRHGRHLVLSGPHTQPYFLMEKSGFLGRVGEANVAADLPAAVVRARELADG